MPVDSRWRHDHQGALRASGGRALGYNPKKPGRPSHAYHTYLMAGLRQVLGVEVSPGNEHTARHAQPGLLAAMRCRRRRNRGWCGRQRLRQRSAMAALEERDQPYLFKLKLSKKRRSATSAVCSASPAGPTPDKAGKARTVNWPRRAGEHKRRVVVLRRALTGKSWLKARRTASNCSLSSSRTEGRQGHYRLRVRRAGHQHRLRGAQPGPTLPGSCRCRECLDELKNQWGWAASPPAICIAANWRPVGWRWPTTGGVCSYVWPVPTSGTRQLPAGRG